MLASLYYNITRGFDAIQRREHRVSTVTHAKPSATAALIQDKLFSILVQTEKRAILLASTEIRLIWDQVLRFRRGVANRFPRCNHQFKILLYWSLFADSAPVFSNLSIFSIFFSSNSFNNLNLSVIA